MGPDAGHRQGCHRGASAGRWECGGMALHTSSAHRSVPLARNVCVVEANHDIQDAPIRSRVR